MPWAKHAVSALALLQPHGKVGVRGLRFVNDLALASCPNGEYGKWAVPAEKDG
jgi:hypothetical protein